MFFKFLEIPDFLSNYPNCVYNKYLMNYLSMQCWKRLPTTIRMENKDKIKCLFSEKEKGKRIKARILGTEGTYPNTLLANEKSYYSFINHIPILVTDDEDPFDLDSEVSFLNLNELLFAASVMTIPNYPRVNIQFSQNYIITLNDNALIGLNEKDKAGLLLELIFTQYARDDEPHFFTNFRVDQKQYHYCDFYGRKEEYQKVFSGIKYKDQLMLRTMFYFIKAQMLWSNRCFGEDAIANVLFSIEGALLLLQHKHGYSKTKINLTALSDIFGAFNNGESLFSFIQEGYMKRTTIVHPSPTNGVEWTPFLMAEDYYEYYDIARSLLHHLITSEELIVE